VVNEIQDITHIESEKTCGDGLQMNKNKQKLSSTLTSLYLRWIVTLFPYFGNSLRSNENKQDLIWSTSWTNNILYHIKES
jgi:hypothetical protein